MDRTSLRLLVVSPLARAFGTEFLGVRWGEVAAATTPDEVGQIVTAERRRFDVVLVDLMWNTFEDEWRFDGLDVVDQLAAAGRSEPAVLACQGHGFERDFLEEGRHHPAVHGTVLKSRPPGVIAAIDAVAVGGQHHDPHLDAHLRPYEQSLAHFFASEPRLARVAGAIAAGHGPRWAEIADVLTTSTSVVEKSPELFRDMLLARGDVEVSADVDKAAIFRWCGEHAHYIASWCRRHAHAHRVLRDVPPDAFRRRAPITPAP